MRSADAPRAGWYPDPQSRTSLRWWDGFDWSDIRRAPPSNAELLAAERPELSVDDQLVAAGRRAATQAATGMSRQDSQQIVDEVRIAARQEIDRAAQQFSDRATTAVRRFTPLISEYTNKLSTWIQRALIISIVLLAAYFVFQVIAQKSFLDWVGDRIDAVTEDSGAAPGQIER